MSKKKDKKRTKKPKSPQQNQPQDQPKKWTGNWDELVSRKAHIEKIGFSPGISQHNSTGFQRGTGEDLAWKICIQYSEGFTNKKLQFCYQIPGLHLYYYFMEFLWHQQNHKIEAK